MKLHFRLHTDKASLPGVRVTLNSESRIGRNELIAVATNRHGYGIISIPENGKLADSLSLKIGSQIITLNPDEINRRSVMAIHIEEEDAQKLPVAPALPWHNVPVDIDDINLIPGVFPDLGEGVFGEGYCERLLPTDQAPLIQELTHLVKTSRGVQQCEDGLTLDEGRLLHYQARWDFLGYSLGNLLKSVSLMPCERISIAVREWQHSIQQAAEEAQSEEQAQTTALAQSTAVSEVMNATLNSFETSAAFDTEASASLFGFLDLNLGFFFRGVVFT